MKNIGKFWTKQEELNLLDELSDKKTITEIAKLHERSEKAIEMRVESMIKKHASENYPISSLVDLYNKSEKEIQMILSHSAIKKIDPVMEKLESIEKIVFDINQKVSKIYHEMKKKNK